MIRHLLHVDFDPRRGLQEQVRETLNWPFAAALSAVLLVFTFAVYALAQRFTQPEATR